VINNVSALKISVWDDLPAAEHGGKILPPLIDGLRTMISGYDWVDVSVAHANKGRALNALMKYLGVEKRGCAAFGDHMNDYEMLSVSGQPFVTANAFPHLKELIGEEIPSNADFGVIKKLKELI
ncbi:MAG: HAD hydrolase family protein, partial [Clostridia bacterium]|nr:HAD hydrolase family protein [Clostridia bacterium]